MAFKGAIFDFDGVVVDTTPLHYYSWQQLLFNDYSAEFNVTIYEELVNGRRSADVIPELLPHLSSHQLKKALQLKQQYYLDLIDKGKIQLFHSTLQLIKELLQHKIKIALASSSRSVLHILKKTNIIHLFEVIISGHDTTLGKPHPESFLQAANKLQLEPHECVIFEDAKVGVQAAKSGGFLCVAVDRKNQPEYFKLADLKVNDLSEITYEIIVNNLFKGKEGIL